ncbi:MAG: serine/threonine protein kinase [Planctomycetes bacterium]|nr:serine/threonine protein kinase [Planctomycetota bacterium]
MARQEDFLFAERALQRGYATEEQVQECLSLLERLREEMKIEETLPNLMVKKGYLAPAQASVLEAEIGKDRSGRPKNAIEGYRLLERIGSGAMGSVYRADHLKLMIPVALKVLRPSLSSSRTQIERLKREAQLAARLSHPNVVRSLDVGESNGFHYLAMEFVEGETVRDLLDRGRVPEKEALAIVRQVALGLAHAHAHGVVHRDVKPGNIMLAKGGTAKLGDFGLARGQGPSDLTLEHASIGTPQYVAPEQMRRGSDATPRSDLFSLGATLYHMVTGRPPFDGENLGEVVQNVLSCRFAPPESLAPELSRDAIYVIDRLMRADPAERYASARDLVLDLERIDLGEAVAPPDFKGDYHAFVAKRRGRRNAILAACVAALAVAGAFSLYLAQGRAKRERLAETCRVADAVRADLESLATAADLPAAILEMEKADADAASAGCADGDVARLRARLLAARVARRALADAGRIMEGSGEPDASYRDLDAKLEGIPPGLPGIRAHLDGLRAQVRDLSASAARKRYDARVMDGFKDLGTARREAGAFAADLDGRYLPLEGEWALDVTRAPRALEELEGRWQVVESLRGRLSAELAKPKPSYRLAASTLADLRAEEAAALGPLAASPYLRGLAALAAADQEARRLRDAEQGEWERARAEALGLVGTEPDGAEALLREFRDRASGETLLAVEGKHGEAVQALKDLTERQMAVYRSEENACLLKLRTRQYAAAHRAVAQAAAARRWVPEVAERFSELESRARRMTELTARFVERAPKTRRIAIQREEFAGDRIEPAPGGDPDRFVARNAKRAVEFGLGDLDRKELEAILAFGPEDRLRRAWFYAAEAYASDLKDPYDARDLRQEALPDLEATDPWRIEVSAQLSATNQRILQGEARAQQAEAELAEARKSHDDVKALALVNELIDLLWWTTHCRDDKRMAYFRQQRGELEQLAGRGLFLRDVGVPSAQLEYGGRDAQGLPARPTTIAFTGRAWQQYEDKVAKEEPNRAARLEQLTREYWTEVFRAPGRTDAEIAELVRRATWQLLPWGGPVEAAPEGGYRPAGAGLLADPEAWIGGREHPLPITLAFPFRADRDWAIEFEVEWPGDPGYFVVAAGRIQAVVGYQRIFPRRGGMAGACILVAEETDPGLKELGDLHWHMANATKDGKPVRRPIEGKEKAYLDETNFVPGVPYRMRLERVGEKILFEMRPLGRDDRKVVLEKRDRRAEQLGKDVVLADGRRAFRFLGIPGKNLGYVLRDVRITGILPERASEEAKQ